MYFAYQHPPAPGILFSRSNRIVRVIIGYRLLHVRAEHEILNAKRLIYAFTAKRCQRETGYSLDQQAQQNKSQIAIKALVSDVMDQGFAANCRKGKLSGSGTAEKSRRLLFPLRNFLIERSPPRQTGTVM